MEICLRFYSIIAVFFVRLSGSETIDSTSSHEEYNLTPLCTENDCDEIYRTARKGRTVGKGVRSVRDVINHCLMN